MYKFLIRPVLFLISPEKVHHLVVLLVKIAFAIPGMGMFIDKLFRVKNPKLVRTVFGLRFENPVGLAAGFDKNAAFFNEFSHLGFGFIEIGTVTPKGQPGNVKPRLFRLPKDKALINRMGFNNVGVEEAVKGLKSRKTNIIIGGNLGKNTGTPNEAAVDDYIFTLHGIYNYVDYLVVNVSCPNISNLRELQDKDSLVAILTGLLNERSKMRIIKPLLLKISPDLNTAQLDEIVELSLKLKLDGIIATNTTTGRYGLKEKSENIEKIGSGGMSGLPLRDRSTEVIRYISQKTGGKLPIIGVGGIMTPSDAIEKIRAGASLVQVYTGFIYEGPAIAKRINKALLREL